MKKGFLARASSQNPSVSIRKFEFPDGNDLEKTPAFKASLHKDLEESTRVSPSSGKAISKYILKQIPLSYNEERVGTLYLRVNTPNPQLTNREYFFLNRLAKITASAIHNLDLSFAV